MRWWGSTTAAAARESSRFAVEDRDGDRFARGRREPLEHRRVARRVEGEGRALAGPVSPGVQHHVVEVESVEGRDGRDLALPARARRRRSAPSRSAAARVDLPEAGGPAMPRMNRRSRARGIRRKLGEHPLDRRRGMPFGRRAGHPLCRYAVRDLASGAEIRVEEAGSRLTRALPDPVRANRGGDAVMAVIVGGTVASGGRGRDPVGAGPARISHELSSRGRRDGAVAGRTDRKTLKA